MGDVGMAGAPKAPIARKVARYLSDRGRGQQGSWISVADVRAALGADPEEIHSACLVLHGHGVVELMGGFPIRPTTEGFTLVRLSAEGAPIAADAGRLDTLLGSADG
jgi:hypothetical protein